MSRRSLELRDNNAHCVLTCAAAWSNSNQSLSRIRTKVWQRIPASDYGDNRSMKRVLEAEGPQHPLSATVDRSYKDPAGQWGNLLPHPKGTLPKPRKNAG